MHPDFKSKILITFANTTKPQIKKTDNLPIPPNLSEKQRNQSGHFRKREQMNVAPIHFYGFTRVQAKSITSLLLAPLIYLFFLLQWNVFKIEKYIYNYLLIRNQYVQYTQRSCGIKYIWIVQQVRVIFFIYI